MHTFTVDKELSTTAGSDDGRSEQVSSGGGHALLVDMVSGKSIRPCVPSLPKVKAEIKTDRRLPRIRLNRKGKQTTSDPPCSDATCSGSGERVGVSRTMPVIIIGIMALSPYFPYSSLYVLNLLSTNIL